MGTVSYKSNGMFGSDGGSLADVMWSPDINTFLFININIGCSTQNGGINNPGIGLQDGYSGSPSFHSQFTSHKKHLQPSCSNFDSRPRATTEVKLNVNLNSSDSVPAVRVIQPTDTSTYNFKDNVTVYDSLGAPYKLSIYFAKDINNLKWNVDVYLYQTKLASGEVQFDSRGMIIRSSGLDGIKLVPYSGSEMSQYFKIDMTCSTQYGFSDKNVETPWQDGSPGKDAIKLK